jgi:integrase/recombinase XerD
MSSASSGLYLDTRKKRLNKLYPVRLRITYRDPSEKAKESKYYSIEYAPLPDYEAKRPDLPERLKFAPGEMIRLNKDDYTKVTAKQPREPYITVSLMLNEYINRARTIIEKLPNFTFEAFEKKYLSRKNDSNDIFYSLKERAAELRDEGRISTARTYDCTLQSLIKFTGSESLKFDKITVQFLKKYQTWMLTERTVKIVKKGKEVEKKIHANTLTTVGMYLCSIRAMYRKAMKQGIVTAEQYPFGRDDYQIPTGSNIKKALTMRDVVKIAAYDAPIGTPLHRYRDYWLFSYLCNGMNIKDMARLKYSNIIDGETINFIRAKTAREKAGKPKTIQVIITKAVGRIIDTWGNMPKLKENYLFPILRPGMNPQQEYAAIQQETKMINKYMKRIAENIGITQKVTTYVARHSFATILKRSGASMEYISESLGHYSLSTTENYMSSFEVEEKKKWAGKLLPGNN